MIDLNENLLHSKINAMGMCCCCFSTIFFVYILFCLVFFLSGFVWNHIYLTNEIEIVLCQKLYVWFLRFSSSPDDNNIKA